MHRIGASLPSAWNRAALQDTCIKPVRKLLMENRTDPTASPLRNHLLMFDVYDFKNGVKFLREAFTKLRHPATTQFIDLNNCQPIY